MQKRMMGGQHYDMLETGTILTFLPTWTRMVQFNMMMIERISKTLRITIIII